MKLALLDKVDEQKADVRLRVLREKGTQVMYLRADVTDRGAVEGALESVWRQFGRLDICMCNAGIVLTLPFLDFTVEHWNRHIEINLNVSALCIGDMLSSSGASIPSIFGSWKAMDDRPEEKWT